jgi:sugar phosphate isomerase/epimerase
MTAEQRTWAIFTKPWRTMPIKELAGLVARLGFNAVEFPLRPGFQVDTDKLPGSFGELARAFADRGVGIASVASSPTQAVFEACAEHGVPLIRIMVPVAAEGYVPTGDIIRRQLDVLVPTAEQYGVRIGIQPHFDNYIADSSELAHLLSAYEPKSVAAIWDAAHDGLARKSPDNALALLWDRLAMVNFKNACYREDPASEGGPTRWEVTFVEGGRGLSSWSVAAAYLRARQYNGPICFPAEYTDETDLERKVEHDLRYLQALLRGESGDRSH